MSIAGGRLRKMLPFAIVVALSLCLTWLLGYFDLIRSTFLEPLVTYFFLPGMMFTAFFVCGIHGGWAPDFLCNFTAVFVEVLVIWLVLRAIWRLFARRA